MAQFAQFQNSNVDAARLQGLPSVQQGTSFISQATDFVGGFGGAAFDSYQKGVEKQKADKKATTLGKVSQQLAGVSQASATTPGYDFEGNVRKVYQKSVAANPSLAPEIAKMLEAQTGVDAAGESREAVEARERTKKAEDAGAINQYMTPEERQKGERLYYESLQEQQALNVRLEKVQTLKSLGELGDKEAKNAVYGELSSVVNKSYEEQNNKVESWSRRYEAGEDPKVLLAEIRQEKLRWGRSVDQFGALATDATGSAMVSANNELLQQVEDLVTGKTASDAYQGQVKVLKSKSEAILLSDPETLAAVTASTAFQHSPTVKLQIMTTAAKAKDRLTNTLIGLSNKDAQDVGTTFTNMATSEDVVAQEEAKESIASLVDEFDRNGGMMTTEDKINAFEILGNDEVWRTASAETKQQAIDAFQLHMADDIAPAIRELSQANGIAQYATLTTDGNGLRLQALPEWSGQRQVQLSMRKANKELAQYNKALNMMMNATGLPMQEVVKQYFGVQIEPEQQGPEAQTFTERVMSVFDQTFVQPSVGVYRGTDPALQGTPTTAADETPVPPNPFATREPTRTPATNPVQGVASKLLGFEGRGDNVTDVVTGAAGITPAAMSATGRGGQDPRDLSDEEALQVATEYLTQLDNQFRSNVEGYEQLPANVQQAILDTAYNVGPQIQKWGKFKAAVKAGDGQEALKQTLDSANESGKAMRGLARRRAANYNTVADVPITTIEQKEDGTLRYLDAEGDEVFSYKPKGGRHSQSPVGVISVNQ